MVTQGDIIVAIRVSRPFCLHMSNLQQPTYAIILCDMAQTVKQKIRLR